MIKKGIILFFFVAMLAVFFACEKPEIYPIQPIIEYKSIYMRDSVTALGSTVKIMTLSYSFTDGDGDIGLRPEDTVGNYHWNNLYYHNLFLTIYELNDSVYEELDVAEPFYYRIPYVAKEGTNRALRGDIEVDIFSTFNDTLKIKFYMVDRALHKSNVDSVQGVVVLAN